MATPSRRPFMDCGQSTRRRRKLTPVKRGKSRRRTDGQRIRAKVNVGKNFNTKQHDGVSDLDNQVSGTKIAHHIPGNTKINSKTHGLYKIQQQKRDPKQFDDNANNKNSEKKGFDINDIPFHGLSGDPTKLNHVLVDLPEISFNMLRCHQISLKIQDALCVSMIRKFLNAKELWEFSELSNYRWNVHAYALKSPYYSWFQIRLYRVKDSFDVAFEFLSHRGDRYFLRQCQDSIQDYFDKGCDSSFKAEIYGESEIMDIGCNKRRMAMTMAQFQKKDLEYKIDTSAMVAIQSQNRNNAIVLLSKHKIVQNLLLNLAKEDKVVQRNLLIFLDNVITKHGYFSFTKEKNKLQITSGLCRQFYDILKEDCPLMSQERKYIEQKDVDKMSAKDLARLLRCILVKGEMESQFKPDLVKMFKELEVNKSQAHLQQCTNGGSSESVLLLDKILQTMLLQSDKAMFFDVFAKEIPAEAVHSSGWKNDIQKFVELQNFQSRELEKSENFQFLNCEANFNEILNRISY